MNRINVDRNWSGAAGMEHQVDKSELLFKGSFVWIAPRRFPRRLLLTLAVLSCFAPLSLGAQEVLNNAAILKMVRAGLSENVVVDMVRNNPGQYILTTDRLIELKRAGVSENAIRAMIAKAGENVGESAPNRVTSGAVGEGLSTWDVHESRDKLTQELRRIEASTRVAAEGNGVFQVTASCGREKLLGSIDEAPNRLADVARGMGVPVQQSDSHSMPGREPLDDRFFSLRFLYVPERGSGVGLRLSPLEQTVTPGTIFSAPTVSAPASCAFLRVLVDDHGREGVQSDACNTPNVASISFANVRARDIASRMLPEGNPLSATVGKLIGGLADANDPSIATMREAFAARQILVELPLNNGASSVVKVEPQEASFREFASKCRAVFPDKTTELSNVIPAEPPRTATKLVLKPIVGIPRTERLFSGTAEAFAAALPGFIQRAAVAAGMEPSRYAEETARLSRVATTCAGITPQVAIKVTKFTQEMVSILGPEYRDCEGVLHPASPRAMVPGETERRIVFSVHPIGEKWRDGRGFRMTIQFTPLESDEGNGTMAVMSFDRYGIVSANIFPAAVR